MLTTTQRCQGECVFFVCVMKASCNAIAACISKPFYGAAEADEERRENSRALMLDKSEFHMCKCLYCMYAYIVEIPPAPDSVRVLFVYSESWQMV